MEMHHHVWDTAAALRLLDKRREQSENAAFLKSVLGSGKRIIADLGCGSGFYAEKLRPFASKLYCIDSSKAMLSVARRTVHGKNVVFLKEDSSKTSLPDSSVDMVFMANSFHDMDRSNTSAEVIRMLKPRGEIIVVDWKKGAAQGRKKRQGPPDNLRMSEAEYLRWFPGFRTTLKFKAGTDHFGILLAR